MPEAAPLSSQGPFAAGARYNSYGAYLKGRFGCRVYKVIVDGGFTCPNRDGTVGVGGCTYCNNESFRPDAVRRFAPISEQVSQGIGYLRRRYRSRKFVVYFQPFSNTYAPLDRLIPMYEQALAHSEVVGLAVGTRPDCIDEEKLGWFERLARSRFVTLEYGLESIYDSTLARINRGHDFQCWAEAVARTRGRGIDICAHVILGFPWEPREEILAMAGVLSAAGIDSIKLHHLHVVSHTALAREYRRQPFRVLEYVEYLDLAVDFLERLSPRIRVERLFGLAPEADLIAPRWGKTKAEIQYDIECRLLSRGTWQGRLANLERRSD
jgi:radical SAM protein (TIGR01212 family)